MRGAGNLLLWSQMAGWLVIARAHLKGCCSIGELRRLPGTAYPPLSCSALTVARANIWRKMRQYRCRPFGSILLHYRGSFLSTLRQPVWDQAPERLLSARFHRVGRRALHGGRSGPGSVYVRSSSHRVEISCTAAKEAKHHKRTLARPIQLPHRRATRSLLAA